MSWFEILENKGIEILEKILTLLTLNDVDINHYKELKINLITTFKLRGILEIYKILAKKFNYFNEKYENVVEELIVYLESFEYIYGDNFDVKKIKETIKTNGTEVIKEFIENKVEIEIIKVSINESKNYIVDLNIKKVEDWLEKKMN
uniref:Uncharacterized protein n=1 Tax=Meloidogyne enterolobii TaxID=390850 RepID=A0A6V7XIM4_MELEN|nr:unnamed protein product [Meloidogyne enterolobii]